MKTKIRYAASEKVYEVQQRFKTELDEHGNEITKTSYETVDVSDDAYIADIPKWEEYTLSNLLAAGIPLEQVNTEGLLSSNVSDALDKIELGKQILNNEIKQEDK